MEIIPYLASAEIYAHRLFRSDAPPFNPPSPLPNFPSPVPAPQSPLSPLPNPQSPIPNPQSPLSPIPSPQSPIPNPLSPIPNPQSPLFTRRDLARCRIFSAGRELTLSIPLVGGAHALAQADRAEAGRPMEILISEHGAWRRRHIAALTTAYSRTPFFDHYAPPLLDLIASSPLKSLSAFLGAIDARILGFLPEVSPEEAADPLFLRIVRERRGELRPGLSIVDLLFRKGPEAIFPLFGALL